MSFLRDTGVRVFVGIVEKGRVSGKGGLIDGEAGIRDRGCGYYWDHARTGLLMFMDQVHVLLRDREHFHGHVKACGHSTCWWAVGRMVGHLLAVNHEGGRRRGSGFAGFPQIRS